jgi:hypothetical protein
MIDPSSTVPAGLIAREYGPTSLLKASFLHALFDMVIQAFAHNDAITRTDKRLASPLQIVEDLSVPGAFTLVTFGNNEMFLATASAEPFKHEFLQPFHGTEDLVKLEGCWALALVATDPSARDSNRGLMVRLMVKLEKCIRKRGGKRICIMATQNQLEAYWKKRGYRTLLVQELAVGCWDSLEGFNACVMIKDLL